MTVEEADLIKRGWDYKIETWTRKAADPVGIVGFVATVTINAPCGTFQREVCVSTKEGKTEGVFKAVHQTYNEAIDAYARTAEAVAR